MRTTEFSIDGAELSPEVLKMAVGGCKSCHRRSDDSRTISQIIDLLFKAPSGAASAATAGSGLTPVPTPTGSTNVAPSTSAFSSGASDSDSATLAPLGF
jgi:hypothetical protein